MKEPHFDNHLENLSDEKEKENKFSFIISNLPTREKHALETLKMTSVDVFCKYDFSKLFAVRGYGKTTVARLQALQKQIREKEQIGEQNQDDSLTLQSSIQDIELTNKERKALLMLNIMTVGEFLDLDLSGVILPKGFGHSTRYGLEQNQKRIIQKHLIDIPSLPLKKRPIFSLPLNLREKKILLKLHISNWQELICFDFFQMDNIPNIKFGTLQSLLAKQTEVRTKIVRAKMESSDYLFNFLYDEESSVFLLELSPNAKEALWRLGISRISELTKVNLNVLKFVCFSIKDAYKELSQIQHELVQMIKKTENLLNDFLASTPLTTFDISGCSAEFLQQNAVNSLQDFIFFSIPETDTDLRQFQFEWQRRYAPVKFLRKIPSYFNILFYRQKDETQNKKTSSYLNDFETAKDFLSATFEDLLKLTQNDLETAQIIQASQYELLKSCLTFYKSINFSVKDEREESWKREINKESLSVLPFFGGKPNRNFSARMFHETFLPGLGLDSVVHGRMLQAAKQIGIRSLGEFLLTPYSHFMLLKHCSKTKITEIQERIQKILFSETSNLTQSIGLTQTKSDHSVLPAVLPTLLLPLDKSTPKTLLTGLLKRYIFSDRAIDVIVQRIQGKTLEYIAKKYGITRERIRQIELKYKNPSDLAYAQGIFVEVGRMLEEAILALGGFAPIHKIRTQFAVNNGWSEQDCTQVLVKFLLDRVTKTIVNHGEGYYSTKSYPCERCELLISKISGLVGKVDDERVTRNNLLATLLNTCCSKCVDLPPRISEFFLDWKCGSDPLYSQLFGDDEIYRSSNRSMQKMVSNAIERSPHPVSAGEILSFICYHTENNNYTEKQVNTAAMLLSSSGNNVFLWDRGGVYAHRKHIPVNNPLLIVLEQKVKRLIKKAKTPYLSLYAIFSEHQSECEAEGIPSAYALHACLKARGKLHVAFMRSPCISVTEEKHKRKNGEILDNWVAQKKSVVSNRSLQHYAREIGLNAQQYNSTYVKSKSLVRYESGQIVHLNSLDWNQAKQNSTLILATDYWNSCISKGLLFARTDQLLSEQKNKLPKLAHGIQWTANLLFSLLLQSESIITFGNTHLAYGFKNNKSTPQTFGDIIFEILKRKYNGKTKLNEISSYLRDDLRIIRSQLTASMLHNHQDLIITEHEIYLAKGKK
jgi:hypothetical protein